jgi:hypothetical protein
MRTISVLQRRQAVVRRHHLGGTAQTPEAVTRALLALHATDPASVYLSVLARSTPRQHRPDPVVGRRDHRLLGGRP